MATVRPTNRLVLVLAAAVALVMTGYGLVLPVLGPRLAALGGGVAELGWATMAFALGQLLAAPLMGRAADRFGRRPLVLLALATVAVANVGYVLVVDLPGLVALRFAQGALAAGLLPASLAIVGDVVAERGRARAAGTVMAGYAAGFVFGPVLGGAAFEAWGYAAPFAMSAVAATVALAWTALALPETRPPTLGNEVAATGRRMGLIRRLLGLLALDFAIVFGFAMVEPAMVFHVYDRLGIAPAGFGAIVGAYGLALVVGQAALGGLSDRWGRRAVAAVGFGLHAALYVGLANGTSLASLVAAAAVAGLGAALVQPALAAAYLAVVDGGHRSWAMGWKEAAAAAGATAGPAVGAALSSHLAAETLFAWGLIVPAAALAAVVLGAVPAGRPASATSAPAAASGPSAA